MYYMLFMLFINSKSFGQKFNRSFLINLCKESTGHFFELKFMFIF